MNAKGQGNPGEDRASRVGAKSPCSDMKRAVAKKLIERYFFQLTDGCGNPDCDNQHCASSGKVTNLTPNQAAAQAIQLFSQEARICDCRPQPSKVARTTLEPGPTSLAKSLPVKNVNPTCSDEGIAPNSNINPACSTTDLVTVPITMDISNAFAPTTFQASESNNIQSVSENKVADSMEVCEEPILIGKSNVSLPILTDRASNLYQSCKTNHNHTNFISNKQISDKEIFLEILGRYKIRIPKYNKNSFRKPKRHRKTKVSATNGMKKKCKSNNYSSKKVSSRKGYNIRHSSRFVTKLLILNMYLRHLEKEKYSKYI